MKKVRKIFRFSLILFIIIVTYSIVVINLSFGENKVMNKKIDLIAEYRLNDVDKIIFESAKLTKPHQHKVIEDEKTIDFIVNELKNITDAGGKIGEYCNYRVSFWKGKKKLLVLGLQIRFYHPDSSFIRYASKSLKGRKGGFLYDYYYISRALYDFFASILQLENISEEELKSMMEEGRIIQ